MGSQPSKLEIYLKQRLEIKLGQKKKLFLPYIAVGYPEFKTSETIIDALIELGADSIELGLPFSDPTADGPTLQNIFKILLAKGFHFDEFLSLLKRLNKKHPDFQFLVMGYLNVFSKNGIPQLFKKFQEYNVSGLIIPDLPLEEQQRLVKQEKLENYLHDISLIEFITPTVDQERMKLIAKTSTGFIYIVSMKGVTGQDTFNLKPIEKIIKKLRQFCDTPLLIGFGIQTRDHAKKANQISDGFIVGSKIINIIDSIKINSSFKENFKKEIKKLLP